MSAAVDKLRRLATKRVASEQHLLCDYLRRELPAGPRADAPLVPDGFAIGRRTPYWEVLGEEERLALDHWTWALMYTRIGDGEEFVRLANRVLADALRPGAPEVADLVAREAAEERDHIDAFARMRDQVCARLGVAGLRQPKKPARKLLVNERTIRALLAAFGVEFVITYFVARGVANHMGMGFERPVADQAGDNLAAHRLSLLHTQDESQHMAVSRLMAAAARDLFPHRGALGTGPLGRAASRRLQRTVAHYTFSETVSKALERRVCHLFVPRLRPLRRRSPDFVRALVDAHFDAESGIEASRNRILGKLNRRLLDEAALPPADRRLWEETLTANQQHLRFVPAAEAIVQV